MTADLLSIDGTCDPAFRRVRDAFAANFEREGPYREVGAAIAVYAKGRPVVDLWGGHADRAKRRPWTRDTLINVWSTTKGLTAAAVALCVERGLVRYEDKVASVWPEFAANGKADITIAQLLSHQAGLPGFAEPTTLDDLENWTLCCERLARQKPVWTPGTQNSYHAMTYGWLAGEIVRRATKRSFGTFAREDLTRKLGADFFVGLPASESSRVAEMIGPKGATPAMPPLPDAAMMALVNPMQEPERPNSPSWRAAEIPAANGQASAQGVARLYAALANGGELDGQHVLSAKTLDAMTAVQTTRADLMLGFAPHWAMGFATNAVGIYGPHEKTFGHSGWGGSFGCADRSTGIAIGYVMNQMGAELVGDPRTTPLCGEVFASI